MSVEGQSDPQGRFRFAGIQPGTYEVVAVGEGAARLRITDVVVQRNTVTSIGALALPPAAASRGSASPGEIRVRAAYTLARASAVPIAAVPEEARPAPVQTQIPIELSPFVVNTSNDDGWLAGTTMMASRTSQALKDVPVSIDALTQEFLFDVGAYDAFAAAEWIANASVTTESSGVGLGGTGTTPPPDSNRYAFRGIPNEGGPTRNLFSWLVPSDTYNVERIDFGRGSNSLMFGDVEPGGQGNIYTKRAIIGKSSASTLLQVGSFDTYRLNLDYNHSFSQKLALRINGTYNSSGRDFDFNEFAFKAIHGAMTYRPFANTIIRVEAEAGAYSRIWGTNRNVIQERRTPGLGFSEQWVVLTDNTIVANRNLPAIDRQGAPAGQTLSLLDQDSGGFPRHYNWVGPEALSDRDFTTASIYLEQKVGDARFELGYNQQRAVWDEIQMRGGYQVKTDVNGRRFIGFTLADRLVWNKLMNLRALGTYNWEKLSWTSQLFIATAELRESDAITDLIHEKNERATTGPLNGEAARISYRVYVDEPGAYNPANLSRRATLPETPDFRRIMFVDSGRGDAGWARAFTLSASGQYFGGRLQSLFGVRHDTNMAMNSTAFLNANRTPRGERIRITTYDETPGQYVAQDARANVSETTENGGLVFKINPNINVYAIYSTSFRAANGNAVNFAGDLIGQQRGETFELGLKSDFFNRKLVWNLGVYDLTRDHVDFQYENTGITEEQLEELFNPNTLSPLDPSYLQITGRREQRKQFSRGVESTLIFYPGRGWNLRVAGAWKEVEQDDSMPRFKGLLADAIARGNENPAYVSAAQDIVALHGADGREIAARYAAPFSFNFAVNYRFPRESRWKNFGAGLNGNFTSGYILNYIDGQGIRGGKLFTLHGTASYRAELWRRSVVFRLNLRNLIETEYVTMGVVKLLNGSLRNLHAYGDPRAVTLTATVDF